MQRKASEGGLEGSGNDQLSTLQTQVNEVKDVMTQNIEKVLERGENLEELMTRSTDLEAHVSVIMSNKKYLNSCHKQARYMYMYYVQK